MKLRLPVIKYLAACESDGSILLITLLDNPNRMKKMLVFLFMAPAFAMAQNYSFVNGDIKFMTPNPAKNDKNPNVDEYVLKPGLPDGTYTIFYDGEMTKVYQKGFLHDGHRTRSWVYYTMYQKPKMELEYDESGLMSGLVKEYYPSGALMTETQFKNGQANGMMVSFYESGIKKMQCGMKNNNMEGKAIFYDETGKVKQSMGIKMEEPAKK
jgi:antitoxin component YwqK of YwqJK toxin-antitoxin module